ncbi:hypothetical protein M0811_04987 [Anaeramoeba ignava]|uniref:Sorting nexin protein WASP-binding domain-containing protein n=1 Tax=Anaeramoeba ignava TaxID=1746090 RepID=A0A9Q0LTE1_ANAIG|nr:hypothetical protein M0811_04987 [Anaeramoeba ignava]
MRLSILWQDLSRTSFDWRSKIPENAQECSKQMQAVFEALGSTWQTIAKTYVNQGRFELNRISIPFHEYEQMVDNLNLPFKTREKAQLDYHQIENSLIKMQKGDGYSGKDNQKFQNFTQKAKFAKKASDTMTNIGLAEANFFRVNRYNDFKSMMLEYVDSQISFYENIANSFRKIRPLIEQINVQQDLDK